MDLYRRWNAAQAGAVFGANQATAEGSDRVRWRAYRCVTNPVRVGVYARIANARWKQRWRYQIFEQRDDVANGWLGVGDFWWWQR